MRKNSKLTVASVILQKLQEIGEATLDSFFPSKYPEARLWRELLGNNRQRFSKRSFSAILSRLRREGLVVKSKSQNNFLWRVSRKGETHIESVDRPMPKSDGVQRIVLFDIPERMRAKRYVIRTHLIGNGYRLLQKSAWIGDAPLSHDFIEILDILHMRPYVHIFSIREKGTL